MSYLYCPYCERVIDEENAKWILCCEEVRYPNDYAHPAEYDGPYCPNCDGEVKDYECEYCGKIGNPNDEILIEDENGFLICSKCKSELIFVNNQENVHELIYNLLVSKYEFSDDDDTHEYVDELIKEYQKIKDEINKLKCIKNLSVPFNEIINENKNIDFSKNYRPYKIKYRGIEFLKTPQKTDRGFIYKTRKPFDELEIEFYS